MWSQNKCCSHHERSSLSDYQLDAPCWLECTTQFHGQETPQNLKVLRCSEVQHTLEVQLSKLTRDKIGDGGPLDTFTAIPLKRLRDVLQRKRWMKVWRMKMLWLKSPTFILNIPQKLLSFGTWKWIKHIRCGNRGTFLVLFGAASWLFGLRQTKHFRTQLLLSHAII